MTIVVNTPNGSIGRPLTARLLDAGESVTVISRHPHKVADLVARGARLVEGSIADRAVMSRALEGASQLFWLTPPAVERPDFRRWAAEIAEQAARLGQKLGVQRAVVLSSIAAQLEHGAGTVTALWPVEQVFRRELDDVLAVRAGFFMDNYLLDLGSLRSESRLYGALPVDLALPRVATDDIALRVCVALRDRGWSGHHIRGVHGPEDLTSTEVAARLSTVLARPVEYVQLSLAQAREALLAIGMAPAAADLYTESMGAWVTGRATIAEARDAFSTTPTRIETWAREQLLPRL